MKNSLIALVAIVVLTLVLVGHVYAGGCCYKYFSATDGIAGVSDAQISVAFIDPVSFTSPLSGQKIDVHVVGAKPGQFCQMNADKTNGDGKIDAHCASPVAGSMSVFFTAPDMNEQANENIKSVPKTINFAANPNAPAPTSTPSPRPVTSVTMNAPTPTSTPQPENLDASKTAELQQRVDSLEKKLATQEKQVNALQQIINSLLSFFSRLFH